ncbi:MAG: YraN family protein, partial [Halioglobus sp.]|nr:YraN family protein [Halioglobus sp.]
AWLQRRGMRVLARNFRAPTGEIDIIALDGAELVFVEVRARANPAFASAAASVTPAKRRRIVATAQIFLQQQAHLAQSPCRFDVVAFEAPQSGAGMSWIRGAFRAGE